MYSVLQYSGIKCLLRYIEQSRSKSIFEVYYKIFLTTCLTSLTRPKEYFQHSILWFCSVIFLNVMQSTEHVWQCISLIFSIFKGVCLTSLTRSKGVFSAGYFPGPCCWQGLTSQCQGSLRNVDVVVVVVVVHSVQHMLMNRMQHLRMLLLKPLKTAPLRMVQEKRY